MHHVFSVLSSTAPWGTWSSSIGILLCFTGTDTAALTTRSLNVGTYDTLRELRGHGIEHYPLSFR
jgi:hypothetical protein